MKLRTGIAVGLLAVCLAAALGTHRLLDRRTEALTGALQTALQSALDDAPDWSGNTEEVLAQWERCKGLMHVMLPHISLNELELSLGSLRKYCEEKKTDLYLEQCLRGIECVRIVREMERPLPGNIF
ncbi:MAG: DUF4363 family protein [Oscillospiraceae bacterium]|jgi:hypothetical protein|nr:DUF4363 family protein [Oscillospiraceae bacterium]